MTRAMAAAELIGLLAGWLGYKFTSRWWSLFGAILALVRLFNHPGRALAAAGG
jgi:hypothetical protein